MVKPQFEVGRERLGAGGVVRDPHARLDAVLGVAACAAELGWGVAGIARSPLPGPAGNVEFFLWLRRDAPQANPARIAACVLGQDVPASDRSNPAGPSVHEVPQ